MAVNRWLKPLLLAAWGLFAFAALPVYAQSTTSAIRGRVVDTAGAAVFGALVTVRDERTGTSTTLETGSGGSFNASGLRVGGPYTVTVTSAQGETAVDGISLSLGDSYGLDLTVGGSAVSLGETTVVGTYEPPDSMAFGPSSSFGLQELEDAPSVNRDIKDVIRADPRIYIDEAFSRGVQCGGASPRFNSLTVDGVRLNDNFGLNDNGYPTESMPFSYDAIEQVAVELAPFDVQYGGFSACNINAVTKSGTNEFHGSAFYDYTDDSLSGDSLRVTPSTQARSTKSVTDSRSAGRSSRTVCSSSLHTKNWMVAARSRAAQPGPGQRTRSQASPRTISTKSCELQMSCTATIRADRFRVCRPKTRSC